MSHANLYDLIESLLDEETAKHPEGLKANDQRALVQGKVVALLADTERDLDAEAEALLLDVSRASRRRRRASMRQSIEYVLDAFTESEESAYIDPMFDLAFPIGTDDGQVKALRFWTADDFGTSVRMAYRQAAATTTAARDHDDACQRAMDSMRLRGVEMFGRAS